MIDIIVGLAPFIFMLVFGLVVTAIDIAYTKRLRRNELKEKNNLKRLLRSYNESWHKK